MSLFDGGRGNIMTPFNVVMSVPHPRWNTRRGTTPTVTEAYLMQHRCNCVCVHDSSRWQQITPTSKGRAPHTKLPTDNIPQKRRIILIKMHRHIYLPTLLQNQFIKNMYLFTARSAWRDSNPLLWSWGYPNDQFQWLWNHPCSDQSLQAGLLHMCYKQSA